MPDYTHLGSRPSVGHYCVTADAHRKPGKVHALNATADRGVYRGLCGTTVREGPSGDHFLADNRVRPASEGGRVTCKRCKAMVAAT